MGLLYHRKDTPVADTAVLGKKKQAGRSGNLHPDARTDKWWSSRPTRWGRGGAKTRLGRPSAQGLRVLLTQQDNAQDDPLL